MGKYFCENLLLEMEKVIPVVAFWRWKGVLKRIMWHLKILISPNYTCLGHFHMEKSFLSGFGNYVAFPLLEIPAGPCNSNSCTFHHSSFSLNLHVFLSFLLYFPFDRNFFKRDSFQFTPPKLSLWMQWFIDLPDLLLLQHKSFTNFAQWWCQQSFQHWISPSRIKTNT